MCGLFDLLEDVIKCLMGGLTLEEGLSSMIKAALKAMSIEDFGELFVGLPPEKQAELDALVKKKLESGEIFPPREQGGTEMSAAVQSGPGAPAPTPSANAPLIGEWKTSRPWEDQEIINKERNNSRVGPDGATLPGPDQYSSEAQDAAAQINRTLAQQFDGMGNNAKNEMDPGIIMEAYGLALIEVYSENLLSLIDNLNKFPGAPIVTAIIALFDCPRPPMMNPSFADFIKSVDMPWCRHMTEITLPFLENPFEAIPPLKDITKAIWDAIVYAIEQMLVMILMKLLVKVCQLMADAICKALEVVGDQIAALPQTLTGREQFSDVLRESICGPDASDQQVEDTIMDMLGSMGPGAAAWGDRGTSMGFIEDLSSSVTRRELTDAFLGQPSGDFLEVVNQLIEYEYPTFSEGLPNNAAIGQFFKNCGNLMPVEFRAQLEDSTTAPDTKMPVNPTICATPEKIENFKNLRKQLLAPTDGSPRRATPEQVDQMYEDMRTGYVEDLETVGDAMMNFPKFVQDKMPNLVSQPGCDDGLIPYESPQQEAAAMASNGAAMEALKIEFAEDMLGNGNLWNSDDAWGFLNMAMSDTEGNPLTAHWRLAHNNKDYVNFATNIDNGGEASTGFWASFGKNAGFGKQHGQFPLYVGEWLMRQFRNAGGSNKNPVGGKLNKGGLELKESMQFNSQNSTKEASTKTYNFDYFDFAGSKLMGAAGGGSLLEFPDFGYGTILSADYVEEKITITRKARKGKTGEFGGDILLDYKDNAAGMRKTCGRGLDSISGNNYGSKSNREGSEWSYGFEVGMYLSDIAENDMCDGGMKYDEAEKIWKCPTNFYKVFANRADDNCRVKIVEKMNTDAEVESPLQKEMGEEYEKDQGLDIPDWLERVPIVGWALQLLVNAFVFPFSTLARLASGTDRVKLDEGQIIKNRRYEFMGVDNGMDAFYLDDVPEYTFGKYPKFNNCFRTPQEYLPQVVLLAEILEKKGLDYSPEKVKTEHDAVMTSLFEAFSLAIGDNDSGWLYGAQYDYLQKNDLDYVIGPGYEGKAPADTRYESAYVVRDTTDPNNPYDRPPERDDMILGISRDQLENGEENARVIYLDPNKFGGSHTNPPLYIKPLKYDGWMGLINVVFPEYTPCRPHNTDLVNFAEIEEKMKSRYPNIPEDPRLNYEEECAIEKPYNRILNRPAKVALWGTIEAAIRIFAATHFMKAIATFSKITPKFPENYSNIYTAYIAEKMEETFKEAQNSFWEWFNPFKDEEFWYAFLEQSVQYYGWLVDQGEVPADPVTLEILRKLNDVQEHYDFPWRYDWWEAKGRLEAGLFESLESYRSKKNLEAVKASEEDAKIILQKLIGQNLTHMGDQMIKNLAKQGFVPDIFDLDYWIFSKQCNGGTGLTFAGPEFVDTPVGLPTPSNPDPSGIGSVWPGPYYTAGNEFRIADKRSDDEATEKGDEFIGYYHGFVDQDGDVIYVAGETHVFVEEPEPGDMRAVNMYTGEGAGPETPAQDLLKPIASKIIVGTKGITKTNNEDIYKNSSPIAQIVSLGNVSDLDNVSDEGLPFYLEKYISINGERMQPEKAIAKIKAKGDVLISQAYPNDMSLVYGPAPKLNPEGASVYTRDGEEAGPSATVQPDATGKEVGISGTMPVRYGLKFSYKSSNYGKIEIANVEVDALDYPCNAVQPFEASSKMLLCLINMLKKDPSYRLLVEYIIPIKKVTGMLAIYNDMGFLSAIGEVTVGKGDAVKHVKMGKAATGWMPGGANVQAAGHWMDPPDDKMWGAKIKSKPGRVAFIKQKKTKTKDERSPNWWTPTEAEYYSYDINGLDPDGSKISGFEGWQHYDDRQPGWFGGLWVMEWDAWDRQLLRRSATRLKKMFKTYYNSRDFPGPEGDDYKIAQSWILNLKTRVMPSPGRGLLPWWKRGKLRSNPFNAEGKLCDKAD